jgi:hypothetical protein
MNLFTKTSVVIALMLSVSYSQAQTRFGVKGGLNLASISLKSEGINPDCKLATGFNLGLISELNLNKNLFLQPGLLFTTKGSKYKGYDVSYSTNNIEIPINLLYKFGTGSTKFFGFAGPYIGYAVSGKYKEEGVSSNIKFSGDNKEMNAFDLGLNIGLGVEVRNFQISAQYGLGLSDLAPESSDKTKNKVLGVSIAYLFGGK